MDTLNFYSIYPDINHIEINLPKLLNYTFFYVAQDSVRLKEYNASNKRFFAFLSFRVGACSRVGAYSRVARV